MTSVLIVTDTWRPQINGVVTTLEHTVSDLESRGMRVELIEPGAFRTLPCPTYPDIRLSVTTRRHVGERIDRAACDHLHVATEGPLGLLGAWAARRRGLRYSTAYHTRFPEYLAARAPVPPAASYAWLRRFHNSGAACMVATGAVMQDLSGRGFENLRLWPRGVDLSLFRPRAGLDLFDHLPRPVWLTVGRVAVEKSLPAFLDLDLPGTKVVVGDGPALARLRARYPDVVFTGHRSGEALAEHYAAADVFVFPSRTDTFGLVMLEAMASGLPVAAFPVPGPLDVVTPGQTGFLSENLKEAALQALDLSPELCRVSAERKTWRACTDRFLEIVAEVEGGARE